MKSNFLENATLGKNEWWRYLLTILSPVLMIIVANLLLRQFLPIIKSFFPNNTFGKDLGTYVLVLSIFGAGLIGFVLVFKKIHQRSFFSLISQEDTFSWLLYFKGFLLWGGLLFMGLLLTDFKKFQVFLNNFNAIHFSTLLAVGFVSIGIQSFFEEILVRGYWLQGLHLRIKNIALLVLMNALIFGILHFGYGIESFLSSWFFGITFALIVMLQNRIEFVSGAHNANNLLLSLVFIDLSETTQEQFSWAINWVDFSLHIIALLLLVGLVYKFFRK